MHGDRVCSHEGQVLYWAVRWDKDGLKYEMQHGCHVVNCAKIIQIVAIDQSLIASLLLF